MAFETTLLGAILKITGKGCIIAIQKIAVATAAEPTTVLGAVVLGTSVLATTYFFGPLALDGLSLLHDYSTTKCAIIDTVLDNELPTIRTQVTHDFRF